jgi:hypothetical protein
VSVATLWLALAGCRRTQQLTLLVGVSHRSAAPSATRWAGVEESRRDGRYSGRLRHLAKVRIGGKASYATLWLALAGCRRTQQLTLLVRVSRRSAAPSATRWAGVEESRRDGRYSGRLRHLPIGSPRRRPGNPNAMKWSPGGAKDIPETDQQ